MCGFGGGFGVGAGVDAAVVSIKLVGGFVTHATRFVAPGLSAGPPGTLFAGTEHVVETCRQHGEVLYPLEFKEQLPPYLVPSAAEAIPCTGGYAPGSAGYFISPGEPREFDCAHMHGYHHPPKMIFIVPKSPSTSENDISSFPWKNRCCGVKGTFSGSKRRTCRALFKPGIVRYMSSLISSKRRGWCVHKCGC